MFSDRTAWKRDLEGLARQFERRRARGEETLDLTESNPTRCGFVYSADEIRAALADPEVLSYRPDPRGAPAARSAIAAHSRGRGGTLSPEHILLTASTSEGYGFLFRLLANPGDTVLAPAPCYPLFELLAQLSDVTLEHYPLHPAADFAIDFDALAARIGPRTRAILVVSPGNPTGVYLKRGELEALRQLCAPRRIPILCDEVFGDFAYGDDPDRVVSTAGYDGLLTFTLNGLSKMLGLPQIKLGWIGVSGPAREVEEAMARLDVISDTYLSVSASAQAAAPRLLALRQELQPQILQRVMSNREWLRSRIVQAPAFRLLPAEGGWTAVLRIPATRSDEELCLTLLDKDGVLVHPGYFYDFASEGYLVLSLLLEPARFREGIERLLARVVA